MKVLLLLFLVGLSSASYFDVFDEAADEVYQEFMTGLEDVPSLKAALEGNLLFAEDETDDEIKTELGKKLREALDHILEKIKEAVEHGKLAREDLQEKLKEIREKMKELKIDIGDKAKELLEKIKEKAKDFIKNLLDRLGLKEDSKRSISDDDLEVALADFNFKDLFKQLKKKIIDSIDKEKLKEIVEHYFGKGSEMADALLKMINEKGDKYKQKILDLIDRFLGKEEQSVSKRSLKEYWEKVKQYFKDLSIDLQDKYVKFGEWVKNVVSKGLDKSKSKMDNIRQIAKEFVDHAKDLSKEVAVEGLNFLKPYKEDLGALYDQVKETVKDILKKQE